VFSVISVAESNSSCTRLNPRTLPRSELFVYNPAMHLVVFESSHWSDLAPFTLTRPACLLRCGVTTLLEKHLHQLGAAANLRITLWTRKPLAAAAAREATNLIGLPIGVNEPLNDEPALLIDGATIANTDTPWPRLSGPWQMSESGTLLAAMTVAPGLTSSDALEATDRWQALADLEPHAPALRRIRHWGDLVSLNGTQFGPDLPRRLQWPTQPAASVATMNAHNVAIHARATLSPGVVLDARNGPVFVDLGATIGANSVLEGPCYVGPHSRITPLSLIRGGTSIGPVCRVGGEVSNTIFQGYSNKSHDGFLGDSVVGQWVNCGAGTTTSNLKSTYGPVKATVGGRQLDTGRSLLGCAIGDHAKLATYTMLAAGGYVGVGSMIATSGRAARYTRSFRFVTDEGDAPLDPTKAAEIAERMHERRDRHFDAIEAGVLDYARSAAPAIE